MRRTSHAMRIAFGIVAAITSAAALAHSASDAYLTLEIAPPDGRQTVVQVQWDIALRDLDFVIPLDDDGDGRITWRELRGHQSAIARYAIDKIAFRGDGKACTLRLVRQQVDQHADGSYAVLFLEAACAGTPRKVALDYRLFFAIDPSHRAIVVSRAGTDTATAVLSPDRARIELGAGKPR